MPPAALKPTLRPVFLDALAHHVGGHRGGVHLHLTGGRLDEVGPVLHREEGGVGDALGRHQQAGLQDHLQDDGTAQLRGDLVDALAAGEDLLAGGLVIPLQEGIEGEDDVDLVGAVPDGQFNLAEFHLEEALGGREAARDGGHVQ